MSALRARWRLARTVALSCAGALVFLAGVQAQPADKPDTVKLVVGNCTLAELDEREVERVLRATLWPVQVQAHDVRMAAPAPESAELVLDACRGSAAVAVSLRKDGSAQATHFIDLSELPASAAARTVAMALAELYDTRNVVVQAPLPPVLTLTPRPTPALTPEPVPADEGDTGESEGAAEVAVRASFVVRETLAFNNLFLGGAIGVRLYGAHAELLYASSSESVSIGDVVFDYTVLAAGYDVLRMGEEVALVLRPRLELGVASARGYPVSQNLAPTTMPSVIGEARGGSIWSMQAAGVGEVEFTFEPSSSLLLSATLCAGYAHGVLATAYLPERGAEVELGSTGGFVVGTAATIAWLP